VAASLLLITYDLPIVASFGGRRTWRDRAKDFAALLSTTFNLQGHAAMWAPSYHTTSIYWFPPNIQEW